MLNEQNEKILFGLIAHHLTRLIIQKGNSLSLSFDVETSGHLYLEECKHAVEWDIKHYVHDNLKELSFYSEYMLGEGPVDENNLSINMLNYLAKKWVKDFYEYQLDDKRFDKYASKIQEIKDSEEKIKIYNNLSPDYKFYLLELEPDAGVPFDFGDGNINILLFADSEYKAGLIKDAIIDKYEAENSRAHISYTFGELDETQWKNYETIEDYIKELPFYILND